MENKKEKKTNVVLVAIITLIIGIAIGIGAIYTYNTLLKGNETEKNSSKSKDNNNKNENKTNETSKIVNIDVLDDLVQDNFGKIMKAAGYYGGTQSEYFLDKKLNNTDIPNYLVFATIDASGLMKDEMTETEFEELVKGYFGEDYKYKHEAMSGKICAAHYYDSNDKKYHKGSPGGCGGAAGPDRIFYMISKAELEGDNLIMYLKVIFPDHKNKDEDGNVRYYSDAAHTNEITNLERDYSTGAPYSNETNLRKGGSYKVVMKKYKDNTYSFVSSEPLK